MPVTESTLRRWKTQLAVNQQLLRSKANRFRWLHALYVRLYQFLVNQYGNKLERLGADVDWDSEGSESHTPYEDLTLDHRGLQPRSTQSLRYVLELIHSNQPTHTTPRPGPNVQQTRTPIASESNIDSTVGEATRQPWIIVASGQTFWIRACEKVFRERGIDFHRRGDGRKHRLEVPFEQRNAAFNALQETTLPQSKSRQRTKRKDRELWPREVWPNVIALVACLVVGFVFPFLAKSIGTFLAH